MKTPATPNETASGWMLTIKPQPGWRVAPVVRLRAALKRLSRSYGMRCVSLRPLAEQQTEPPIEPETGGSNDA